MSRSLTGSVDAALANAARWLEREPALAAEQAREILRTVPGHPLAELLLAGSHRVTGDTAAALGILEPLTRRQPRWALGHYELGLTHATAGDGPAAVASLRRAVELHPNLGAAWRALGDQLGASGDAEAADAAYAESIRCATQEPRLLAAAAALCENRIPEAEAILRDFLKRQPTDVAAIRMLAEVAARLRRYADAESLLQRCLELAPGFEAARHNYAVVLHRQSKLVDALREVERLLEGAPRNPGYLSLKAAVLARIGDLADANAVYAEVLAEYPKQPKIWMSYGHALKSAGRIDESIAAYRRSIEQAPGLGEAYWSLANLKTFRFPAADLDAMQAQLLRSDLSEEDRFHLHFALGKALEDAGRYEQSFDQYLKGNALRRASIQYDPGQTTDGVWRSRAVCTADFFAHRAGYGAPDRDPIFIVGLPRSGSTLLEQILSSHPAVEGTMELADIGSIAKSLWRMLGAEEGEYPELLARLSAEQCRALGAQYLEDTRVQRKSAAPFFIDKMPNNFAHLGLIHLILPQAKIIDARRHPLACCFSAFKQHFARGQYFSYRLEDLGRYYRDYVELMAHFDRVLPGRVHRVIYERLVDDPQSEVRRLLAYCDLPFEDRCLRFYENQRPVRTASAQQVRQPIFREGLDQWRHFERWLGPLRSALGPILTHYPDAPVAPAPHSNRRG